MHARTKTELSYFILSLGAIWAVANHYELRRNRLVDSRKNSDYVAHPLHAAEVGDVHEDWTVAELSAEQRRMRSAIVDRRIDEVMNHSHVARSASKCVVSLLSQEFGDCGQPIRALD